jgi:DNA-binding transcriptional MerR regulator/methylmalonyl-CoA mutase cobalamin-binding subunit
MEPERGAWLSIGALARATGIPAETLRTWETRYGFPVPRRKPSGHRVYPVASVERLRRVARALALGHRAGEVVAARDGDLDRLLDLETPAVPAAARAPADVAALLEMVTALDAPRLTGALLAEAVRLGPLAFARDRVAPLLEAVGEAWAGGRLEVRHEHLLSERVADVLRSQRLALEERATGPLVLFATLAGEGHGLGLQMAALVAAAAGLRILYIGTDVPLGDLVAVAREAAPAALALSVSSSSPRRRTEARLARLRARLPRGIRLVVGGAGAPDVEGAVIVRDLDALDAFVRGLAR